MTKRRALVVDDDTTLLDILCSLVEVRDLKSCGRTMERQVGVANEFSNIMMKDQDPGAKITPKDAIGRLRQISGGRLDQTMVNALCLMIERSGPKSL